MRTVAALIWLAAVLLTGACEQSDSVSSDSLVGATDLPSAEDLSGETIEINRGGGPHGGDRLSYEWRPDDSLTITHDFSDGRGGAETRGTENLRIDPAVAAEARRLLWRVRPAEFEGVGKDGTLPIGCERQSDHDFGEVAVVFINEERSSGRNDARTGIFQLPYPESCNTPAAVEARKVIQRVLQLLPKSEVAAEFGRSK